MYFHNDKKIEKEIEKKKNNRVKKKMKIKQH